jgi:hypothetical protein
MLRDAYADDNCWLLAIYLGDSLGDYLDSGWLQLRRAPQGVFFYFVHLPYRYLQDPFVLWNTLSLAVQLATPLVLYRLVRNLCADAWLAAFAASVLVVVPLDHVVPYVTSLNYRLGLLLGLSSLVLTDSAAREGRVGWRLMLALVFAALAAHVLTEAAIGFEPARALLLANRFRAPGRPHAEMLARTTRWLVPFALLAAALVAYKLVFKPYGIYGGMYSTGLAQLFDPVAVRETTKLFALGLWRLLRRNTSYAEPETLILGLIGAIMMLGVLLRFRPSRGEAQVAGSPHAFLVALGVVLVVPVLFIFQYAGRPAILGPESNHATLMQPGYALVVGSAVHWLARRAHARGRLSFMAAALGLALLTGSGVYFNNLNLDLFKVASARQDEFWRAFKKRFPMPPPSTAFMIDAVPPRVGPRLDTFFQFEDLHPYHALELSLNRLYRPGLRGERRYRVYPIEDLTAELRSKGPAMFQDKLVRTTHFGQDTLDFAQMTYVYWRGGEVLLNGEIAKRDPAVVYREVANKPLPPGAKPLAP